jgi:hypothetical protein
MKKQLMSKDTFKDYLMKLIEKEEVVVQLKNKSHLQELLMKISANDISNNKFQDKNIHKSKVKPISSRLKLITSE